jgi:flagellar biosynthetic protein FliP
MPPNQVVLGLSLFLTYFVMAPVWEKVYKDSYLPYQEEKISQDVALEKAIGPIKSFMLLQTSESDLTMFMNIAELERPKTQDDVPLRVLMPAFLVSELKTAFQIGFLIYIPFLVIDMVVSSVLMAMGMMMLPPTVISLPFKLVLFVLVDGWALIIQQLVSSIKDVSGA